MLINSSKSLRNLYNFVPFKIHYNLKYLNWAEEKIEAKSGKTIYKPMLPLLVNQSFKIEILEFILDCFTTVRLYWRIN